MPVTPLANGDIVGRVFTAPRANLAYNTATFLQQLSDKVDEVIVNMGGSSEPSEPSNAASATLIPMDSTVWHTAASESGAPAPNGLMFSFGGVALVVASGVAVSAGSSIVNLFEAGAIPSTVTLMEGSGTVGSDAGSFVMRIVPGDSRHDPYFLNQDINTGNALMTDGDTMTVVLLGVDTAS